MKIAMTFPWLGVIREPIRRRMRKGTREPVHPLDWLPHHLQMKSIGGSATATRYMPPNSGLGIHRSSRNRKNGRLEAGHLSKIVIGADSRT